MSDRVPVVESEVKTKNNKIENDNSKNDGSKPTSAIKRDAVPETSSHIAVRPLYTPADLAAWDYNRDVGYPGEFPYTRGVQATMYRGRLWTMRQYAGMG